MCSVVCYDWIITVHLMCRKKGRRGGSQNKEWTERKKCMREGKNGGKMAEKNKGKRYRKTD